MGFLFRLLSLIADVRSLRGPRTFAARQIRKAAHRAINRKVR
jgi:hypothetical protein